MAASDYNNFLVRLTPKSRALLDIASKELEMPRAHIINNALKSYLNKYNDGSLNERINRLAK
jgi:predicted DNA-binding protein